MEKYWMENADTKAVIVLDDSNLDECQINYFCKYELQNIDELNQILFGFYFSDKGRNSAIAKLNNFLEKRQMYVEYTFLIFLVLRRS